jgi:hypothetical protein
MNASTFLTFPWPRTRVEPDGTRCYVLTPGDNARFIAQSQTLTVEDGFAWASLNGEDHILAGGESLVLHPGGDGLVFVSALQGSARFHVA